MSFQPASDINLMTVNWLMTKLDKHGSEDFMIDMDGDFKEHWAALVNSRMSMYESDGDLLVKDL